MNETEKMLLRRTLKSTEEPAFAALYDLIVSDVLAQPSARLWSVQGFGMLRAYLGPRVRLHVWDPAFKVPNVTEIHDHPWHFTSIVLAGRIRNVRYRVERSEWPHGWVEGDGDGPTHIEGRIMCGERPTEPNEKIGPVRLAIASEESYGAGESYSVRADELHATYPDAGTITLCRRTRAPEKSADHALVYWPMGATFVKAEPREATELEVHAFLNRAHGAMLASTIGRAVAMTEISL